MRNQFLATFLAKPSIISLVVATCLLAGSTAMAGDPVYKWKDANGESHYSQQPPEGIKYETITTAGASTTNPASSSSQDAGTAQDASGPTPADTDRKKYCDTARKNVDLLTSKPMVSMDIHGDGKPVALTPEQQTAQLAFAKQQVAGFCTK